MWEQQQEQIAPWLAAGMSSLPELQRMASQPTVGDIDPTQTPGYQFRLNEGMNALENSLAARGLSSSGAAMKGITRYGQDYASGEYMNEFNRQRMLSQDEWNRHAGLAGIGQQQVNQLGQLGGQYASNVGNALIQGGQQQGALRASAYNNMGNIASGIGNMGANLLTLNSLQNQMQQLPQTNYVNPYWSQQNPLGLTPGQGL
jgi:hypothetical protein